MRFFIVVWMFCVLLLVLSASTTSAQASEQFDKKARYFDLPALPLNQALKEFALQSGTFIAVSDALVRGHESVPLIGPFYPEKALSLLIAKANLVAVYDQKRASFILLEKSSTDLAPLVETAKSAAVEEVVITGSRLPARYPNAVNSFVRGGISQFDSVRSHQFVSQTQMRDVSAQSVIDALAYSSGITPGDGIGSSNDDFFLRGFPRHGVHRDDFKYSDQTAVKIAPETIESLQLVKGPASLFYGQSDAGGVVNATPVKPIESALFNPSVVAGEDGVERLSFDWNWAGLDALHTRFVGVFENESDSLNTDGERLTLLSSARLYLPKHATLDVSYEYQNLTLDPYRDYLILRGYDGSLESRTLAQSVNYAEPDFSARSGLFSAALHLPLSDHWRMQASFNWQDEKRIGIRQSLWSLFYSDSLLPSNALGTDDVLLNLAGQISIPLEVQGEGVRFGPVVRLFDEQTFDTVYSGAWTLNGLVKSGRAEHRLALGLDMYRLDRYYEVATETRIPIERRFLDENTFFNILQAQTDYLLATDGPLGVINREGQRIVSDELGAFANWHARWNTSWSTSLGVRYSDLSGYWQKAGYPQRMLDGADDLLMQAGITFQPVDQLSIFANYSESLLANVNVEAVLASPLTPQQATQRELGAKYVGFNGRLNATVAAFDAYKQGLPILLRYSQHQNQVAYYNQQVTGIEADVSFELNRDTQFLWSGAVMDPRIDGGVFDGNYAPMAADITQSLFIRRRLHANWVARFGGRHASERSGDLANQFVLESFRVADLHIEYEQDTWDAVLSVKNITDKRYAIAVVPGSHEHFADGREVQLQLRYHWEQ